MSLQYQDYLEFGSSTLGERQMSIYTWLGIDVEIPRNGSNPADTVVVNGQVLTCDSENRMARAFAVKEGKFVYVGDENGLADYIGDETKVIDARDRIVTPGFIDSHCHLLWIGALGTILSQDLYFCKEFEKAKEIIRNHADKHPDLPFVFCMGWEQDVVPGEAPTKEMLDAVMEEKPLILWSECAHRGWVNTAALDLMRQRNPKAYEQLLPVKRKDGEPTGEFLTFWFIELMDFFTWDEIGEAVKEDMRKGMERAVDMALSYGITAVDDVMVHRSFIPQLLEFKERGGFKRFRARGTFYINHHMAHDEDKLKSVLEEWKALGEKETNEHLILGKSVKMGTDGVSSNHTAFLLEPYSDIPDFRGESSWTQEKFNTVVKLANELGLQVCTHACGDGAIRMAVTGYEKVAPPKGRLQIPHRIDHCSNPTIEDLEIMSEKGICAAMQPTHFMGNEASVKSMGEERMKRSMPFRSMCDMDILMGFGSDYCAGPLNPIYGLLVGALRVNYRLRSEWGPEEKIDIPTAIRNWTIGSAKTMLLEDKIGSIEVGKFADFVIFGTNPLKIDSWWFILTHKIKMGEMDDFVDMTFVDGKPVYEKK